MSARRWKHLVSAQYTGGHGSENRRKKRGKGGGSKGTVGLSMQDSRTMEWDVDPFIQTAWAPPRLSPVARILPTFCLTSLGSGGHLFLNTVPISVHTAQTCRNKLMNTTLAGEVGNKWMNGKPPWHGVQGSLGYGTAPRQAFVGGALAVRARTRQLG